MSISSLASVACHVFAIVICGVLGYVISLGSSPTMPVEAIELGDAGGGGGSPGGLAFNNQKGQPLIERATAEELPPDSQTPNVTIGALPDVRVEAPLPDLPDNPDSDRLLDKSKDAKDKLKDVGKGSKPPSSGSHGKGGSGSGGGSGTGAGPATGSGAGDGPGGSIRAKRQKRWTMMFNTFNGEDYLRQLSALGCILIVEFPNGKSEMYRKLSQRPAPAEPEDREATRNRMRWIDENTGSVAELARAMGISAPPSSITAYFPFRLEDELLHKELTFRGRKEEDIHATRFQVYIQGNKYTIVVVEQQYVK